MTKKDKIFDMTAKPADFSFNKTVAGVFDDMLIRSVPFYSELQRMIGEMAATYYKNYKPGTRVYDLGCSTGTTLIALMHAIQDPRAQFVGVDNSAPMIEKAVENIHKYSAKRKVSFVEADLTKKFPISNVGVLTMNWTLQFVRPIHREALLKRIHEAMVEGGIMIVCEKVLTDPTELNRLYIELYYNFKRRNGYSELEIAKKREALENVLIPNKVPENAELFRRAGFRHVDVFFRWYNWAGFIAIK